MDGYEWRVITGINEEKELHSVLFREAGLKSNIEITKESIRKSSIAKATSPLLIRASILFLSTCIVHLDFALSSPEFHIQSSIRRTVNAVVSPADSNDRITLTEVTGISDAFPPRRKTVAEILQTLSFFGLPTDRDALRGSCPLPRN